LSSSSIQTGGLNDFGGTGRGGNGQHLTGGNGTMEQQQTAESLAAQNLVNSYVKNGGYSGYEQLLQLSTNGNYFQDCLTSHHHHHHHISHSNRPPPAQRHLSHLLNDKDPGGGGGGTDSGSYENNNQQQQLSPPI
jgi:hypothetical protein